MLINAVLFGGRAPWPQCWWYHSSTRRSCRSSAAVRHTTGSGGHTDGCYRTARCLCTPLRTHRPGHPVKTCSTCPPALSGVKYLQQLASSTSRGQSGKPSQIIVGLMQTLLPGHSHRARSEHPVQHKGTPLTFCPHTPDQDICLRLTTVVLVAVVVAVQVSVTAFGPQDAAARLTLEVAGRALCYHGNKTTSSLSESWTTSIINIREDSTVHAILRQQAAGVPSLLWKLAAVRVLGPLETHDPQNRLTFLLRVTTQRPAGRTRGDRWTQVQFQSAS